MKRILLIITICFITFKAYTQRGPGNPKIKAFKIAFITEKLNLNETEAEKFWPIYNKFEDKKFNLIQKEKKEIRKKVKEAGGIENIDDKDAEKYLSKLQDIRKDMYQNSIQFHNSLVEFLPAKKILLLEIAEHEFNRRLMERLKNRRMNRRR
ncbi:hypothetical protein ACOSP6_06510 [Tenacibaculum sp. MEBiC06402]|uniref:hypothetical protein n=1 Tax=unclassified Tenacibaculum TaxID=2635139 RepID=UPI003B9CA19B